MARRASSADAVVGVSDHCGWAVFLTVGPDHEAIDRRRVQLVDPSLPALPHHTEGQMLPLDRAVALVENVQISVALYARDALQALSASLPMNVAAIAIRECAELPETIAERITSYRAQTMADGVMYRQALAEAARARGWSVHWYSRSKVIGEASEAIGAGELEELLKRTGTRLGRPWREDHRVAMAAAVVLLARRKQPPAQSGR